MILEAIDRASRPVKRIGSSMLGLGQSARRLGRDLAAPDKAYQRGYALGNRLRGGLDRLSRGFRMAGSAAKAGAGALGLAAWTKATELAQRGTIGLAKRVGSLALGAAKWGALGAVGGVGWLLTGIVSTGAKFEQFQAQLEGTEGSVAGAKKAMSWVLDFAKKTPYEMDEVTDAFVRARQLGIDPMSGAMTSMGDAAAGNRKTLMEAVEAIADARTNQYERLKEFGITSSTKGSEITFSFVDKGGKAAFRKVKKDAVEIQKAIFEIWDAKNSGGMIRQSKTLVGLWSNIKDSLTSFQYKIAQSGWFDSLKNKAATFLETLNKWQDSGKFDVWAAKISDKLTIITDKAWEFLSDESKWRSMGEVASNVATAFGALATAISDAVRYARLLNDLNNDISKGSGPIDRAGRMKDTWDKFNGNYIRQNGVTSKPGAGGAPSGGGGGGGWGSGATPRITIPRKVAANDAKVGGLIRVQVETKPGTTARVAGVSSTGGVNLQAGVGRTMSSAA